MVEAYLSLGSNLGDRRKLIDEAVVRLTRLSGTRMTAHSSYYRTAPVGPIAQEWFLNIAIGLETTLTLAALREACRAIEASLGRDRSAEIAWGPRSIDIDIVYAVGEEPRHPEMMQGYVLAPLAEIAGSARIAGRTVADLAREADLSGVERLDWMVRRN
jgi:2-amino-4-hydroxy-6-hydroxymethyldihydropteridine diphosphokinase